MKCVFYFVLFLNLSVHLIITIPGITKSWIQEINYEPSPPPTFWILTLTASAQKFKALPICYQMPDVFWLVAFVIELFEALWALLLGTLPKHPSHGRVAPVPCRGDECCCLVLDAAGTGPLRLQEHVPVGQPGRNNLPFLLVRSSGVSAPTRVREVAQGGIPSP